MWSWSSCSTPAPRAWASSIPPARSRGIAARYVMESDPATARYAVQREVVLELVDLLLQRAPDGLLGFPHEAYVGAGDDAARLRAVIDHVASLTDRSALANHAALRGR